MVARIGDNPELSRGLTSGVAAGDPTRHTPRARTDTALGTPPDTDRRPARTILYAATIVAVVDCNAVPAAHA